MDRHYEIPWEKNLGASLGVHPTEKIMKQRHMMMEIRH